MKTKTEIYMSTSPLQNALILSYLHSKMTIKNLEIALHELMVINDPATGKLQHNFEKLKNYHKKAMGVFEKNIENKDLLESDIESQIDNNWSELISK